MVCLVLGKVLGEKKGREAPLGEVRGAGGGCCGSPTSSLPQEDLRQRFLFFFFFFFSERELTQFFKAAGNGGVLGLGEVGSFLSLT